MGAVTLLDRWLQVYDVTEHHSIDVRAAAQRAYAAARSADLGSSPTLRALFAARGLLPWLRGRGRSRRLTIDSLVSFGFVLLEEDPGREIVLGLVGRFWRPSGGLIRVEPADFVAFDGPGYAKAVWNFRVDPSGDHSIVSTETRVRCTDAGARRAFGRYWRLVGPFSGYIRGRMLAAIKREAEAG